MSEINNSPRVPRFILLSRRHEFRLKGNLRQRGERFRNILMILEDAEICIARDKNFDKGHATFTVPVTMIFLDLYENGNESYFEGELRFSRASVLNSPPIVEFTRNCTFLLQPRDQLVLNYHLLLLFRSPCKKRINDTFVWLFTIR